MLLLLSVPLLLCSVVVPVVCMVVVVLLLLCEQLGLQCDEGLAPALQLAACGINLQPQAFKRGKTSLQGRCVVRVSGFRLQGL